MEDLFDLYEWDSGILEYDGDINLSKGAIVLSDRVSTVSEQYAKEILTQYYSHGLSHILEACKYKMCGIVNGIDTAYYDPTNDRQYRITIPPKIYPEKQKTRKSCKEFAAFL